MLAVWIALFGVLFHALIPAGFMPGRSSGGEFTIVICSPSMMEGLQTMTMDASGEEKPAGPEDQRKDKGQAAPCSFSAVLAMATPEASPALPMQVLSGGVFSLYSTMQAMRRAYMPVPGRAPPVLI
ncbi:DUF2946 family protein [Pannonibacter sp. Pt2-lr]